MSVEANSQVVIGFAFDQSEFWVEKTFIEDFRSCSDGHRNKPKFHDFCFECGKKLDRQKRTKTVLADNYAKFLAGRDPNDFWPKNYNCLDDYKNVFRQYLPECLKNIR